MKDHRGTPRRAPIIPSTLPLTRLAIRLRREGTIAGREQGQPRPPFLSATQSTHAFWADAKNSMVAGPPDVHWYSHPQRHAAKETANPVIPSLSLEPIFARYADAKARRNTRPKQ
jgi:hypothetical protein